MSLSAERKLDITQRVLPTLVTQLKAIREMSSGADANPRATLKSRYDSTGTVASVALNSLLGFDRSIVDVADFGELVDAAALLL